MKGMFFTHKSCLKQHVLLNRSSGACSTGRKNYLCINDESCIVYMGQSSCCFHAFSPMTHKPKVNEGPMRFHLEYRYIAPVFHTVPRLIIMLDIHPLNWLTLVKSTVKDRAKLSNKSSEFLDMMIPVLKQLPNPPSISKMPDPEYVHVPPKDTIVLFKLQAPMVTNPFQVCV